MLAVQVFFIFSETGTTVGLQERAKKANEISLRADIDELANVIQNEQVKTNYDIERLKGEIRQLTNEKAELETLISKSKSAILF